MITKPPDKPRPSHEVALWAGFAALFGSLLAIGVIDVFNIEGIAEFVGSLIVAIITGGAVYSKERLEDAKKAERGGN